MKNEKYYVGLDIGTDSVGYAVTDEQYNLCKFKSEPMWGVTLFDPAQLAVERRKFRAARRRLDRKQQRVHLIQELFANEISKIDEEFFRRIKESYLYPSKNDEKVRLFDTWEKQKEYTKNYPTIHHLINELMNSSEPHDVRLLYLACAWLVTHRGHFLSDVNKHNINEVTDFKIVYEKLATHITREYNYTLPWKSDVDLESVQEILKAKSAKSIKLKALTTALFGTPKAPKNVNEQYEYNYDCILKLLCGYEVNLSDLFNKNEYNELEEKKIALNKDDETLESIMQSIGDDAELISVLKNIYDWAVLVDVLKGCDTISEAKVKVYKEHENDLKALKYFVKKYAFNRYSEVFRWNCAQENLIAEIFKKELPNEYALLSKDDLKDKKALEKTLKKSLKEKSPQRYTELFGSNNYANNYVSYIGKNKTNNEDIKAKKTGNKEDFHKYILSIVSKLDIKSSDLKKYNDMITRLETNDFLPKQVDGDNRVIPYQLYWYELNKILENAKSYIPFLKEIDEDGISGKDKVLSVFEFRVPYYVGPLKTNPEKNKKVNHWMVRKAEGKIYPWNFNKMVDLDASENEFIARMTNSCSYLPGEDVLPKNSLVYSAFEVLNEINNIKINGNDISLEAKQSLFNNVFLDPKKVTPERIKKYLISNNYISQTDILSGLDITVKSSLKPFIQFNNLVSGGLLSYADVEKIINRATYSEDKKRFKKWLRENYSYLPENEIEYVSGLKFKEFGRLSRKLLCGIEGAVNPSTGEYMTIIRTMWETNLNFMQIVCSDAFDFKKKIEEVVKEHYGEEKQSLSEKLDDMRVSNAVKRPIIRALDILKDVVKVQGKHHPDRIFIEMARGASEDQKGKRTATRLEQIKEFYKKVRSEDVRELQNLLDSWGDFAHNKLQSDKLFLYFIQLGKCLYTGESIDIESLMSGDGKYNIDHIRPRCFVKDDSVINNLVLVDSKANERKGDGPVPADIIDNMRDNWAKLNKNGLISDEKFKRLTRSTHFTEEEKFEFINRQLVETRQSTKAIATLLKEIYPDTEIVYVKAGLVSDFRHAFDLVKSRKVNDLHHAKDAYLNIVVGNVWHSKFSRQFWRPESDNNAKPEIVFTHPVVCGDKTVWNGAIDKNRVIQTAKKNTAHMTKYSFCRKGGFFDQMPLPAAEELVPRKKDMPTEIYGGYNKTTASFFTLVRYKIAQKQDVIVMPVELLYVKQFINDENFADEYAKKTIGTIVNKQINEVDFVLNRRILKINTMLSLNGLRVCVTGKSGGGRQLGIAIMDSFKTSSENEIYIKKLESFINKKNKNSNIVYNEMHDEINKDKNLEIYDGYIKKLQETPYCHRPANPIKALIDGRQSFISLSCENQVIILLDILGLFGRIQSADLTSIGGVAKAGVAMLSSSLSNWKNNYTDVRIIDQSASGLYEEISDNLLDLL